MLKRINLVVTLLMALVGIVGVQAQSTATPQMMAQYFPVNTDAFFALRTDEVFLDELTDIIHRVSEKLPEVYASPLKGFDLRLLLNTQVGSLGTIGVGDYAAGGVSELSVLYDQDLTNDARAGFYGVIMLTDAAKFEAFFERMIPNMTKTNENGITVYSDNMANKVFITPDAAYITNQVVLPVGDRLDSASPFVEVMSKLPEPSYNFVAYVNYEAIVQGSLSQMTPQNLALMTQMGFNPENLGPIAVGGTVLDDRSLVIDSYNSSLNPLMPSMSPLDANFTSIIPSGMSYVFQATDLKTTANMTLDMLYKQFDLLYKQNEALYGEMMTPPPPLPNRESINAQSKAFFGLDIDSDILDWMDGNYILIGDANLLPMLEAHARGETVSTIPELRFAFIIQGDGSDKPAKVVQGLGNWLVLQGQHEPSAPQATLSTTGDTTSVVMTVPAALAEYDRTPTIEMVGNPDMLIIGDQATVQAILNGTGASLTGDASFLEAQMYVLPNANAVMFADGVGWGNIISGGIALVSVSDVMFRNISASLTAEDGSPTPTPIPTDNLLAPVMPMVMAGYEIISSSSVSIVFGEGGTQTSRVVLTLK